ncbi:hypothetical protein BHE74_00047501 [Ensete ventricosum]|nr:hypothetical protein BHE74_00047501 [Ensete ventricosum]
MVINFARCYAQSRVFINFSCTVSKIQNTGHSQRNSPRDVVRARFRKKTRRSYTLREVARKVFRVPVEFRSIFRSPSQKFKILAIPDVLAHGKSYEHGFTKKHDGHKLCAKSRPSRVSIDFSCTISEIENIPHSQRIGRWEVLRTQFHEKMQWS